MPRRAFSLAGFRQMAVIVPFYIALIAGVELAGALVDVLPGAIGHALLIVALLLHFIVLSQPSEQDYANPNASHWFIDILPVLALAPLMRLLSLTIAPQSPTPIASYALIGIPLLLAVLLTARLIGMSWDEFDLALRKWPPQLGMALLGVPLGWLAYSILRPQPVTDELGWRELLLGTVILTLSAGFTAEIIFRGMLQRTANGLFGRSGLVWSSTLFAVMHIPSLSPGYVVFAGLMGLFFAWHVNRTGSLWGVVLAHGFVVSGLVLVWPHLLP